MKEVPLPLSLKHFYSFLNKVDRIKLLDIVSSTNPVGPNSPLQFNQS